ncbi:MAG TPA: ribonuclease E inhibitor RraB [Sphingomonas sp.]|jgi:hypothetical protein|uniref:ribonuclease E inhibitor RraB n=1 Tax=Sphingomonas sp. TaxID=28214 RepID=UPI002ED791EB
MTDEQLAEHFAEDDALLEHLAGDGDRHEIPRDVDVGFVGDPEKLEALADALEAEGWDADEVYEGEDGEHVLEVVREQAITRELIHALTAGMIAIAEKHGVTYDGWGCHLEAGTDH